MSHSHYRNNSRLGKMPHWQRTFILASMSTCALTGIAYLLGHEFFLKKDLLGIHAVLAWHGITALIATLALGSVLPFHLKAGLKAKRQLASGLSQLGFLAILLSSGALLYYGPETIRESVILTHWLIGLVFFAIFMVHGVVAQIKRS